MKWMIRIVLPASVVLAGVSFIGARPIEAGLPPIGRFITVDGIRLHYTDHGSGPPVLSIHGASSNLMEFQDSLDPRLLRHHRGLVFDRPGYGYSERSEGPWPDPAVLAGCC